MKRRGQNLKIRIQEYEKKNLKIRIQEYEKKRIEFKKSGKEVEKTNNQKKTYQKFRRRMKEQICKEGKRNSQN